MTWEMGRIRVPAAITELSGSIMKRKPLLHGGRQAGSIEASIAVNRINSSQTYLPVPCVDCVDLWSYCQILQQPAHTICLHSSNL